MNVTDEGHRYSLDQIDPSTKQIYGEKQDLQFLNIEDGRRTHGVTTQEVIRALIDRTWYCNDCLPWSGNKLIVDHLRMALMLHEARAMIRGVEKSEIEPEKIHVGDGGHFCIMQSSIPASDYALMPDTGTETGSLSPGVCAHEKKAS